MTFHLNTLLRKNIRDLVPYSSAREEYKGQEGIFLDANENAYGSPLETNYNRYPDPLQSRIKVKLKALTGLREECIFLGNGSDEAIDILIRGFCDPQKDNVIVCPPTYGMYEVAATINDVNIVKVPLLPETFQLDVSSVLAAIDANTKLLFICSPNNPTGTGAALNDVKQLLESFSGIVVVDEAYIHFSSYGTLIPELATYPNLVILQTLSKAWGLAGLRVGMAFASAEMISIFNKIKPPYNINTVSQNLVEEALDKSEQIQCWTEEIISERNQLMHDINTLPFVIKVYPSDANFFLVKTTYASSIYEYLTSHQVIVRDRSKIALCEGCLRITVGTPTENKVVLQTLRNYITS